MVFFKEFCHGAKYKHNMNTKSILESIELGVSVYARRLHEDKSTLHLGNIKLFNFVKKTFFSQ